MPASGSIKDRLRVFESPSETTAPEPPPKKVGPKPRSVVDQYTQNLGIQRESKSPSCKQLTPSKAANPKDIIDSREEVEETRPDTASRWDVAGRQSDHDAATDQEQREQVVVDSPRKAFAAYEALIQKNNQGSSPFGRRFSPAPSVKSSTPEQENDDPSSAFHKPLTPSELRKVGGSPFAKKPSPSLGVQKATGSPRFQKLRQNQGEDATSTTSPYRNNVTTQSPVSDKIASPGKVYALPSPALKTSTPPSVRRITPSSKQLNHTSTNRSQDQGVEDALDNQTQPISSTMVEKKSSAYHFSVSPRKQQNPTSAEKGSPASTSRLLPKQKDSTPTKSMEQRMKDDGTHNDHKQSSQQRYPRLNLRKVASPVRSTPPSKGAGNGESRDPLEKQQTSSPVMFPLFPARSKTSKISIVEANESVHVQAGVVAHQSPSRSPLVVKKLARNKILRPQETSNQTGASTVKESAPAASHPTNDQDPSLKAQTSAEGSTTKSSRSSRLLEVRARSPALFKAFSLEMKRSVDAATSGLDEKSTCSGTSSVSNEELGDIARQAAHMSDKHTSKNQQEKPSPLSQMQAFNRTRKMSQTNAVHKEKDKGGGAKSPFQTPKMHPSPSTCVNKEPADSLSGTRNSKATNGTLTQKELLSSVSAFRPAVNLVSVTTAITSKPIKSTTSSNSRSQPKRSLQQELSNTKKSTTDLVPSNTLETKSRRGSPDENVNVIEPALSGGKKSRADRYAALLKQKHRSTGTQGQSSVLKEKNQDQSISNGLSSDEINSQSQSTMGSSGNVSAITRKSSRKDTPPYYGPLTKDVTAATKVNSHHQRDESKIALIDANNILFDPQSEPKDERRFHLSTTNIGRKSSSKTDYDASFGQQFEERLYTQVADQGSQITTGNVQRSRQSKNQTSETVLMLENQGTPLGPKEVFEAGCRIMNARKYVSTEIPYRGEATNSSTNDSNASHIYSAIALQSKPCLEQRRKQVMDKNVSMLSSDADTCGQGGTTSRPHPSPNRNTTTWDRKSDQSYKVQSPLNRFQRGRVSDVSARSDTSSASKNRKAFKYQALGSPGDDSFGDRDTHDPKGRSPYIVQTPREDTKGHSESIVNSASWLNHDFPQEWTGGRGEDNLVYAFPDASDFEDTRGSVPDNVPSFGSLTDDDDDDAAQFPLKRTFSPIRSVDVGENKPTASPRSPRSPRTPSRFQDVRSLFENAAKSPSDKSKNPLVREGKREVVAHDSRNLENKFVTEENTETHLIDQTDSPNGQDSWAQQAPQMDSQEDRIFANDASDRWAHKAPQKVYLVEEDNMGKEDDHDSWAPQPPQPKTGASTEHGVWKPSPWVNDLSVEEKVMSSIERLYNTNMTETGQARIAEDAMNPFSLSAEFTSGSFPSTFDETAMETDPPEGGFSGAISSPSTAEARSSISSSLGKGANRSHTRSIGQSGTSDVENSMLHGEMFTEDGSGLQFSSGSKSLKMSSNEDSARKSSATGNFFSSSSSQMSKSTISREEFLLKDRTRSTVSSTEVERLAPISDVIKEEEQGISQDESGEQQGDKTESHGDEKLVAHLTTSSYSTNRKESTSEAAFEPNSRSDTLRWWQKKYAQKAGGPTNSAVKMAFTRKNEVTRIDRANDDEDDVFSGLEEDPKVQDSSFDKALNEPISEEEYLDEERPRVDGQEGLNHGSNETFSAISLEGFDSVVPPPPPPPPPSAQSKQESASLSHAVPDIRIDNHHLSKPGLGTSPKTPEDRRSRRTTFKKKVGTIVEVSESEMSDDAITAETGKNRDPTSHSGKLIDRYEVNKVTSDITSSVIEGRDRPKTSALKAVFGKIDEVSEHQSTIDSKDGTHLELKQDTSSRTERDSRFSSYSRMTPNSRPGSHVDSGSRLDLDLDTDESDSQPNDEFPEKHKLITESESHSVGEKPMPTLSEESEESARDDAEVEEDIDADTVDISYAESKERTGQSAFESTAAAVMSIGYAIFDSFSNACKLSGKLFEVGEKAKRTALIAPRAISNSISPIILC